MAALAAIGLGACCGIPLLLAAGTTATIAGVAVRSWVLVLAGLAVAALTVTLRLRRRDSHHVAKESTRAH